MHNALTIVTAIKPAERVTLENLLLEIGNDICHNSYMDFTKATTTHFCRWVIFDEETSTPQLLFTSNFDGTIDTYIDTLIAWLGPALDSIWGACIDYPTMRTTDPALFRRQFHNYLTTHSFANPVFFRAYFNRSVEEVRRTRELRDSLRDVLNTPASERFGRAASRVPLIEQPARLNIAGGLAKLVGLIFAPFNAALNRVTYREPGFDPHDPGPTLHIPLTVTERVIVQNELTIIAQIEPSRLLWMRIVLLVAGPFTNPPFTKDGKLSDMTTIHFARWSIINGREGKRLMFESNYDGSWEKYIDDFIDHAWRGLDLIFGNCVGWPKGGSRSSQYFKQAIIDNQKRAQVFYSAYPDMTVRNILNNLAISDAMGRFFGVKAARQWLNRL